MGKDRGNYRRTILELVLVTAIFAVVSVFILKIYLTADRLRGDAVAVSTATVQSESIAETVKLSGVQAAAEQFDMEAGEGYFILRFDKNWNRTAEKEKYQLVLVPGDVKNGLAYAVIYAGGAGLEADVKSGSIAESGLLCRLNVAVYVGEE